MVVRRGITSINLFRQKENYVLNPELKKADIDELGDEEVDDGEIANDDDEKRNQRSRMGACKGDPYYTSHIRYTHCSKHQSKTLPFLPPEPNL